MSLLSVKRVAKELDTSPRTVYRMLELGLPFYDMPGGVKIDPADLEKFKD